MEEIERIVELIRVSYPDTKMIIRGDSRFCREDIFIWWEDNDVGFFFGVAKKNSRLSKEIEEKLTLAKALY